MTWLSSKKERNSSLAKKTSFIGSAPERSMGKSLFIIKVVIWKVQLDFSAYLSYLVKADAKLLYYNELILPRWCHDAVVLGTTEL
jgi:hypothetical protein